MKREGIKVENRRGTWYIIDERVVYGMPVYLLESEIWGDEAACLVCEYDAEEETFTEIDEVWNGLDEFEDNLEWSLELAKKELPFV